MHLLSFAVGVVVGVGFTAAVWLGTHALAQLMGDR